MCRGGKKSEFIPYLIIIIIPYLIIKTVVYKGKKEVCKSCFLELVNNVARKWEYILDCIKCCENIRIKFLGTKIENTRKSGKIK